jgi:hypothetical protein
VPCLVGNMLNVRYISISVLYVMFDMTSWSGCHIAHAESLPCFVLVQTRCEDSDPDSSIGRECLCCWSMGLPAKGSPVDQQHKHSLPIELSRSLSSHLVCTNADLFMCLCGRLMPQVFMDAQREACHWTAPGIVNLLLQHESHQTHADSRAPKEVVLTLDQCCCR